MTPLSLHISQLIEAPFLDASVTNYHAKMWAEQEDGTIIETPSIIGEEKELSEEKNMIVFFFPASYVDMFHDGDRINVTIWNEQHSQDWFAKHAFKARETHVEIGPDSETAAAAAARIECHRLCIDTDCKPSSFLSAGSTAYSIVEKISGMLESIYSRMHDWLLDELDWLGKKVEKISDKCDDVWTTATMAKTAAENTLEVVGNIDSKLLPDISRSIESAKSEILNAFPLEATEEEVLAMFDSDARPYIDGNGYLNNFTVNDDGTISSQYTNVHNDLIEE